METGQRVTDLENELLGLLGRRIRGQLKKKYHLKKQKNAGLNIGEEKRYQKLHRFITRLARELNSLEMQGE